MASRTLSLQAYLAYARSSASLNGTNGENAFPEDRGTEPLIMGHAEDRERGRALVSLCTRMLQQRPELRIVLSGEVPEAPGIETTSLPVERPGECEKRARGCRPDFLLWAADILRPALLKALHDAGTTLVALPPSENGWSTCAPRWLPDPTAPTLALFDQIHCRDAATLRQLRRQGIAPDRLSQSGAFLDTGPPLDCDDALHEDAAAALAARPLWLAALLQPGEAADILRAHRRAVRLAHRLLLIIVPANEDDADAICRMVEGEQMRLCRWDRGDSPDDNTQVLLLDGPEELGLWYRISPLAFLGGSLVPGHGGADPFQAAALGTAILYGPNVGAHLTAYSRLVEAGAARIVRDADSLATAVSHLVAPDQAATMAHAGWDAVSSGAELVDAVIAEIFAALDEKERP